MRKINASCVIGIISVILFIIQFPIEPGPVLHESLIEGKVHLYLHGLQHCCSTLVSLLTTERSSERPRDMKLLEMLSLDVLERACVVAGAVGLEVNVET